MFVKDLYMPFNYQHISLIPRHLSKTFVEVNSAVMQYQFLHILCTFICKTETKFGVNISQIVVKGHFHETFANCKD